MKRRDALKNTGLFVGISLSAGAISTLFQSCKEAQSADIWKPDFIPEDLVDLVAEIAETILPKTDLPGAKDLKIHQFLDRAWSLFYKPEIKQHIMKGLLAFDDDCKAATGKQYLALSEEERHNYLVELDKQALAIMDDDEEVSFGGRSPQDEPFVPIRAEDAEDDLDFDPFFSYIRGNVLWAYYTSEEIGKNVLTYDPIPGQAIGCMDLEPDMKVYSF
ncbi:MAG: gluconate 2-dehydrogenase subunit 3 family protein [Bacteroidia bacterium]|nr:gluconate 2-dehydrogenase subunit 3 family protein [Bacteroidia bacterium]